MASGERAEPDVVARARRELRRRLKWGLALIAAGPVASLVTYLNAVGQGGGRYYVFWGLPVFGVLMAAKAGEGLVQLRKGGMPEDVRADLVPHARQRKGSTI